MPSLLAFLLVSQILLLVFSYWSIILKYGFLCGNHQFVGPVKKHLSAYYKDTNMVQSLLCCRHMKPGLSHYRKGQRLGVLRNRVLEKIFGPLSEDVKGD